MSGVCTHSWSEIGLRMINHFCVRHDAVTSLQGLIHCFFLYVCVILSLHAFCFLCWAFDSESVGAANIFVILFLLDAERV